MKTKKIGPYADVLMDRWFKRTFGWSPAKRLLQLFLQELIPEREIVDLSYGPQEHINPVEEGKDVRMDVECTDRDGSRFVVEMQVAEQGGFYNRAVFNSTFAVQEQIPVGKRSFEYPPVYFIGILGYSIHKGSDQVLYRYSIRENKSNELMTDCLQFLFLELPNCTKALTAGANVLDNFCYALYNMHRLNERPEGLQGEIFDLLFNSAKITNFAPAERAKYIEDMTTKEDIQRMIYFAEDKGIEKGIEQGIEKGIEKGRQQNREEIARRMLENGQSVEFIVAMTGLSSAEVLALNA